MKINIKYFKVKLLNVFNFERLSSIHDIIESITEPARQAKPNRDCLREPSLTVANYSDQDSQASAPAYAAFPCESKLPKEELRLDFNLFQSVQAENQIDPLKQTRSTE